MPRREALPAEIDPCARELVEQLRRLKDRDELTMRHLAAKTGYSAKSWERYLGGASLPPREAVEALARLTGADPVPLLALHEVAADTWDGRRGGAGSVPQAPMQAQAQAQAQTQPQAVPLGPPVAGPSVAGPVSGRLPHLALTVGVLALAVAVLATLLLVLRLEDEHISPAAVAATPSVTETSPPSYTCRVSRVDGRWSAGVNGGRDTEIVYGATGADVAEAQCLLRRTGISPGGIDGMFGPLTLRAVKTFQRREGLVVDGMLGPRSWKALRG
ncbi:helix-turn-helix domain-containing protein [Streptomyces apricus]|uniref:Helix-turn-helix domain-containing protein n=2 Tax=Streptomyces apricus TaxID=1828112 RepID=A0A5B0BCW7_9ACTN|nr:helix-turn-helix domain-containing protein [Streptomyces apricus]